jgi:type III secretory pathway component EscT
VQRLIELLGGEDAVTRGLVVATLVAARVGPVAALAPWLTLRATAPIVRTAVIVALTACLAPLAYRTVDTVSFPPATVVLLAAREALLGTIFAIASALPLYALDWAGRLVDTWRGASLAEVLAPPTGERTSPLGDLYLLLGVAVFAATGGHRLAIAAFAETLSATPVGVYALDATLADIALGAARITGHALAFAMALAAPAAVAIVAVEVSLGLVARTAPQVPVFFAGMPLRAATGIAAALIGLSVLVGELPGAYRAAIQSAEELLRNAGP